MRSLKKGLREGKKAATAGSQSVLAAAHSASSGGGSSATLAAYVPGSAVVSFLFLFLFFPISFLFFS